MNFKDTVQNLTETLGRRCGCGRRYEVQPLQVVRDAYDFIAACVPCGKKIPFGVTAEDLCRVTHKAGRRSLFRRRFDEAEARK